MDRLQSDLQLVLDLPETWSAMFIFLYLTQLASYPSLDSCLPVVTLVCALDSESSLILYLAAWQLTDFARILTMPLPDFPVSHCKAVSNLDLYPDTAPAFWLGTLLPVCWRPLTCYHVSASDLKPVVHSQLSLTSNSCNIGPCATLTSLTSLTTTTRGVLKRGAREVHLQLDSTRYATSPQ